MSEEITLRPYTKGMKPVMAITGRDITSMFTNLPLKVNKEKISSYLSLEFVLNRGRVSERGNRRSKNIRRG